MWLVIIDGNRYGYKTYKDACNDINRFNVEFNGLFFVKLSG